MSSEERPEAPRREPERPEGPGPERPEPERPAGPEPERPAGPEPERPEPERRAAARPPEAPPPEALTPTGLPTAPLSTPRHLHPAEIVLAALENLREILIAAVLGLLVGGGAGGMPPLAGAMLALGGVVVAAVIGYVRWRHTTYSVAGEALHFRRGVISPDETSVPLGRIQAVDATQGPVQRLFGVQELHVQTAGGGSEGEIVLRAVSEAAGSELRAIAGLPDPVARDLPEWRLGLGALLVTAVTAPQLGVILPLVGVFAAAGDDVLFGGGEGEQLIDKLIDDMGLLVLVVIAVAGAALLLSFAGAIVAFAGFSLVRDGERLRIRRGLLARRAASVPLSRVHAVDVVEGVLRRPFGLASVRMETAGYRSEAAAAQTLLPLVRVRDVPRLLAEFVPALAETAPQADAAAAPALERPPARARRRYALPPALAGAALGAVLTAFVPAAWPAVPLLALLGAAEGVLRYRSAGWRDDGRRLVVRGRVLARRTLLARVDRLQEHGLRASPVQRRASLADFEAAVGSGRTGRVKHLEAGVAGALFERLRPRAG
jgi:putative membrane protein